MPVDNKFDAVTSTAVTSCKEVVPVAVRSLVDSPPKNWAVVVVKLPRAVTDWSVSDSVTEPVEQKLPFDRQIPCPATVAVAKVPMLAMDSVLDAIPCRFTEKTVAPRSLIPRIRKSLALDVPFDRTSRAERVPVAEEFSV